MTRSTGTVPPGRPTDRRGQTTLDFAIAMGVFLLTIAFVFSFVPTFTAPFSDGDQELSAASDRIANHLAEGALGDVDAPYVVEEACMTPFFDETEPPASCGFGGNETREHLGIGDRFDVQVEVLRVNTSGDRSEVPLCHVSGGRVTNRSGCDEDHLYRINTSDGPPEGASTTVSKRVVTVAAEDCAFADPDDGEACDALVNVRVW